MNVLILSQYYPPEPDPKIHGLGLDLARRGHRVRVITGFPNYPQGRLYPGWRQKPWMKAPLDRLDVWRLPLYPDHSHSRLKRSLNYLSFAASASLGGPVIAGSAEVMWVYSSPLTIGIPAWWIGLWRRIPFVFNIHDMWPETLVATKMMEDGRAVRWLESLAQFIYRRAAAITVVSPGFKRLLVAKGVPEEKVHFIPNWAEEDLYRPRPRDEILARKFGLSGRFNIVFGGTMGPAQGLDTAIEAAAQLQDFPQIQFVLIGGGVDEPRLRRKAAGMKLRNVIFIGWQPAEIMPRFFALADVLLLHLKRDPLFEITIPGKTFVYLACGRPILCAVAGDTAEIVREAGAGLICPPDDPEAMARTVRTFYAMPSAERNVLAEKGRSAHLTRYSRAVLITRHEELLVQAVQGRRKA